MFRITFNVGTGRDKDGQIIPHAVAIDALQAINERLIHDAGGFTAIDATGGWRNDSGHDVVEDAVQYVTLVHYGEPEMGHDEQRALAVNWARNVAQFMRKVLNQDSVLIQVESVQGEFVS